MVNVKPNILIIHADQHRYDCLGAYGNPDIKTPHIDALAADGRRFDNHFCAFPVCTPSRYSLLSGQYVRQHRGWTNHSTLAYGIPTFPQKLSESGYRTTAVGKMHFTPTYLNVGFEEMFLAEQDGPGRYDDDYHRWLIREGYCDTLDLYDQVSEYRQHAPTSYWESMGALPSNLDEEHHSTTWIANKAIDILNSWDNGGNLLMVGFIKPHHPFDPPEPWNTMYSAQHLSLLPGWLQKPLQIDITRNSGYFPHTSLNESILRRVMTHYYATISQIDYHVGRMIEILNNKHIYDNTLIIYTSDHGEYMGFHHLLLKGNYMYEPLVKVPLIIKFPYHNLKSTTTSALVSNLDIAPTLLKTAGCEIPPTMKGMDLADTASSRNVIITEGWAGNEIMVRTHDYKLLHCADAEQSQLFDLSQDPLERMNCIAKPDMRLILQSLREELLKWGLFDTKTQPYLDDLAPQIKGSHVPEREDNHFISIKSYFAHKMAQQPLLNP